MSSQGNRGIRTWSRFFRPYISNQKSYPADVRAESGSIALSCLLRRSCRSSASVTTELPTLKTSIPLGLRYGPVTWIPCSRKVLTAAESSLRLFALAKNPISPLEELGASMDLDQVGNDKVNTL